MHAGAEVRLPVGHAARILILAVALLGGTAVGVRGQDGPAPPTQPAFGAPMAAPALPRAVLIRVTGPAGDAAKGSPAPAPKQAPAGDRAAEQFLSTLRLAPPSPDELFRLESEKALRQRLQKEAQANPDLPRPVFPPDRPQEPDVINPRTWPWYTRFVEPNYLCHGRLYFQQVQAERYGRDFGVMVPVLSTGIFYFDTAALPVRLLGWPCAPYECHADYYSPFFCGWMGRH
jgi:hypothetical protein